MKHNSFKVAMILMTVGLAACGGPSEQEMTAEAIGQTISLTVTAVANAENNVAQSSLQTAEAQATAVAITSAETQTAADVLIAATAAVEAPIIAELPTYGVDPENGHVGWIHPPTSLVVTGYLQYDYVNDFISVAAENFVISTDITWDTTGGLAGCGLVLRSNGNQDALSQYLVIATRGANGRVIFSSMLDGKLKNGTDNYAGGLDPNFDPQNGTTNRLTVVGRGNTLAIYTNGVQIGQVVAGTQPVFALPPAPTALPASASADEKSAYNAAYAEYEDLVGGIEGNYNPSLAIILPETPYFEKGFLAMVAVNESGTTSCQFNNSWLWIIDN